MESSSKGQEERRILEEQIKSITENIESEGKAYTELTARLKYLEDSTSRQKELEEVYQKLYGEKLLQFEKTFERMKSLKEKLEVSKKESARA